MRMLPAVLVLLSALAPLTAQDGDKKAAGPACDLAKVEEAIWCPKCKKAREKDQLEGDKCKVCQTQTEKLLVCVKTWIPRCGMHEQKSHAECCCKSKKCCVPEINKSPVVFRCTGCGQSAREEGRIVHDPKAHEMKVIRTCEASGTAPHGGEPIK